MMFSVEATKITKRFGASVLFRHLSFRAKSGEVLAVTGWNGAGKSTLLRILAGLERATSGSVLFRNDEKELENKDIRKYVGMCAPSFSLYGELTGLENMEFLCRVRNIPFRKENCLALLGEMGLGKAGKKSLGTYSSGMLQRLKLAQALLHDPPFLVLDEPGSNLDERGKEILRDIILRQREKGVTLLATNEEWEVQLSDRILNLSQ